MLLAATAGADTTPYKMEFSFFGGYLAASVENDGGSDTGGIGAGISNFINNDVSVGLQTFYGSGNDVDIYTLGVNGKYHFPPMNESKLYVGGQLNYAYARDPSRDGTMWGPLVGLKGHVTGETSIFIEYQYQIYTGKVKDTVEKANAVFAGLIWGF